MKSAVATDLMHGPSVDFRQFAFNAANTYGQHTYLIVYLFALSYIFDPTEAWRRKHETIISQAFDGVDDDDDRELAGVKAAGANRSRTDHEWLKESNCCLCHPPPRMVQYP